MRKAFSKLVYPMKPRRFMDEVYGKKPYLFDANSAFITKLFSSGQLNEIIRNHQVLPSQLELTKLNRIADEKSIFVKVQAGRNIPPLHHRFNLNVLAIFEELHSNSGMIVNDLHILSPKLDALVYWLERESQHPMHINGYWGLPNSVVFRKHADKHHVFIAQIEGEKEWKVYSQNGHRLLLELTLKAGQVLYIPQGFYHAAKASPNCHSFHLTIGMEPERGAPILDDRLIAPSLQWLAAREFLPKQKFRITSSKDLALEISGSELFLELHWAKFSLPPESLPWVQFMLDRRVFSWKEMTGRFPSLDEQSLIKQTMTEFIFSTLLEVL
jgi:hypothetical protein